MPWDWAHTFALKQQIQDMKVMSKKGKESKGFRPWVSRSCQFNPVPVLPQKVLEATRQVPGADPQGPHPPELVDCGSWTLRV